MKSKTHFRNDLILIGVIFALVLVAFLVFMFNLKEGKQAVVTVNGETVCSFDLKEDISQCIKTDNGENTVVISNGEVKVSDADCRDKICVNHRAISKIGETIVCLPHKLVVEITEEG